MVRKHENQGKRGPGLLRMGIRDGDLKLRMKEGVRVCEGV